MPGSVGGLLGWLGLDAKAFLDGLGKADQAVTDSAKTQESAFGDIGGSLDGIGKTLAGLGIGAGIAKLGSDALDVAAKTDKLHAGFVGLNGATAETEKLFSDISNLELASSFDFEDTLGPASKALLTAGVNAKDTTKYMQAIVDTAAGLKLPEANIESIAATMGKMTKETNLSVKSIKALETDGVPAGKMLADQFTKGDIPKAMELIKSGAISSKVAIASITDGMEGKFKGAALATTTTWKGAMNQLDQATEGIMDTLGHTMKDALNAAAPILTMIVGLVKQMAEWFNNLGAPVKTAIVAFVGIVGAIAAVTAAAAPFMATIGAVGTALAGPVLPIAALVAGLVALGAWVYSNWDKIAPVLQSGLDAITAAVQPVVAWFKALWQDTFVPLIEKAVAVWDALKPVVDLIGMLLVAEVVLTWKAFVGVLEIAWSVIKGVGEIIGWLVSGAFSVLSKVVGGVADIFTTIFGPAIKWVVDRIVEFIGWLGKIPGIGPKIQEAVGSFDSLKTSIGNMTGGAKKGAEASVDLTQAVEALDKANAQSVPTIQLQTTKHEKATAAKVAAKEATKELKEAEKEHAAVLKQNNVEFQLYIKTLERDRDIQKQRLLAYAQNMASMKNFAITLDDVVTPAVVDTTVATVDEGRALAALQKPMFDAESGMKRLGVQSTASFNQVALDAQAAYNAIAGTGTKWETDNAMLRMLKAQQDAARANNTTLTKEQLATLNTLETQLGNSTTKQQTIWGGLANSVSTVITNFAQDISKSLWDGDMSWGEKGKKMLTDLGQAVTSSFVEPATKALGTFITGTLTDLMGDKGFGGVGGLLGKLGGSIGGIFGGIADHGTDLVEVSTGIAASAAKAAGDVASTATKSASSMTGMLGSLAGIANPINMITGGISAITGVLDVLGIGVGKKGEIDRMNNIANDTRFLAWCYDTGRVYLNIWDIRTAAMSIDAHVASIDSSISALADRSIQISVVATGVTTKEAATALGNQIAANLATQLVAV